MIDHAFETRKAALESECKMEPGMFDSVRQRLVDFMEPYLESFPRHKQADHATTVVNGLCFDLQRKNAESIAYHFGMERKPIQHFLGESQWDDEPLRQVMVEQIAEQLGTDEGVLIFDPSSFPKSGK